MKYLILDHQKIQSIKYAKDSNTAVIYGGNTKYEIVVIKTKPNTALLNISTILSKYNILEGDRKLRVCINKTIISYPKLILIDADAILNVEITTEKNWINAEDANTNERFINIRCTDVEKNGL
jgi:ABC-type transport system involved in Fe-S cluster assembly fused permease/ATPase subunit